MHYLYLHLGLPRGYRLGGFPIKIRRLHNARHQFYFNENLNASSEIRPQSLISTRSNMLIKRGALKSAEEFQNILTASKFKANMVCNATSSYV
jgi:hypothetical protein